MRGFDCSGFVCELMKAARMIGPHDDLSSQALFDKFQNNGAWNVRRAGSLVFYGQSPTKIEHVGMLIDSESVIQASGGDSNTKTLDDAIRDQAFVKIRHIQNRGDLVAVIRPKFLWEMS